VTLQTFISTYHLVFLSIFYSQFDSLHFVSGHRRAKPAKRASPVDIAVSQILPSDSLLMCSTYVLFATSSVHALFSLLLRLSAFGVNVGSFIGSFLVTLTVDPLALTSVPLIPLLIRHFFCFIACMLLLRTSTSSSSGSLRACMPSCSHTPLFVSRALLSAQFRLFQVSITNSVEAISAVPILHLLLSLAACFRSCCFISSFLHESIFEDAV
jgi:hypothetical protein